MFNEGSRALAHLDSDEFDLACDHDQQLCRHVNGVELEQGGNGNGADGLFYGFVFVHVLGSD